MISMQRLSDFLYKIFLKKWHGLLPVLLLVSLLPDSVFARHIIGGEVRYECLGKNVAGDSVRFQVIFTMYRDSRSGGANFDNGVQFGIYRSLGNGTWDYVRRVSSFVEQIREIPANNNDPCIIVPPNIGVEEGIYQFEVWLPVITTDYMIAYQRCCRNPTISNLFNPDATGAAFTITISPLAQNSCNNSPRFKGFPPVVLCANEPLLFDHSASDVENDQIVYEFCTPLASGGQQNTNNCQGIIPNPANCLPPFRTVNFLLPGFSFSKPMAGDPVVSVNPVTGIISGTPQVTGQFVVGVCIKEYRNGVLLSSTQRDFQFNVQQCGRVVTPKLMADKVEKDTFIYQTCRPGTLLFRNISLGGSFINSYDWEFYLPEEIKTFTTRDVELEFTERGTYYGKLILNKVQGCKDSAMVKVDVFPEVKAAFDFVYDTCYAGPVQFLNASYSDSGVLKKFRWSDGVSVLDTTKNPLVLLKKTGISTITLEIEDKNQCKDTLVKNINWQPVPSLVIVEPDIREACVPARISFSNLSRPVDDTYQVFWQFGNGDTSRNILPVVDYNEPGSYDVELQIISPIGCVTTKKFADAITIHPVPAAGFSVMPDSLTIFNKTVTIQNNAADATSALWFLNNEVVSFEYEPVFEIPDSGYHEVKQVVFNRFGCSDTSVVNVDVVPLVTMYVPDAFTPNKDGLNDHFLPVGYFDGIKNYRIKVTNRWGETFFESADPLIGWNGTYKGTEVPPGQFLYKLIYTEPRGETVTKEGFFHLLR